VIVPGRGEGGFSRDTDHRAGVFPADFINNGARRATVSFEGIMADEQKPKAPKKAKKTEATDDILTSAAKAIGTAAGKIATLAGVAEPAPERLNRKSTKPAKLQKKNNPHLPRKLKKAQKKAAAAQARP
jgi:hypothetical protein